MLAVNPEGLRGWCWSVLLAALICAGCAGPQRAPEEQAQVQEKLEDILSQPLDAEEYGTASRCISQYAYRDFEPLGEQYVLFEGTGGKLWLNELRGRCPGLRHGSALAFDMRGSQICDLDRFKVTDWFHWSRYRRWPWDWVEGIPCTLGKFQPVSAEQAEAIRATLSDR
jgi:hypothetical protein